MAERGPCQENVGTIHPQHPTTNNLHTSTMHPSDIKHPISQPDNPPTASASASASASAASSTPPDLPPSYDDAITLPPQNASPILPDAAYFIPESNTHPRKSQTDLITLNPSLSADQHALHDLVTRQARVPPRPCLVVKGVHTETRSSGQDNRTESVVDFNFQIDLTRSLLRWDDGSRNEAGTRWFDVQVVADGDGQKAFRGARCRSREWRDRRGKRRGHDVEEGRGESEGLVRHAAEDGLSPGLLGWCERFCNDPARVKSFTFNRTIQGFDASSMNSALTSQLRSLNYRGNVHMYVSLARGSVTVYSPHWINRLRTSKLVYWLCIILQLWILTWPVIWLLERRYEVIQSVWYSSRGVKDSHHPAGWRRVYACGYDENALADYWGPAVTQAAWERRLYGEILSEQEVERLLRAGRDRRERGGVVIDPLVPEMVRGVGQIGQWDMTWGWGADT